MCLGLWDCAGTLAHQVAGTLKLELAQYREAATKYSYIMLHPWLIRVYQVMIEGAAIQLPFSHLTEVLVSSVVHHPQLDQTRCFFLSLLCCCNRLSECFAGCCLCPVRFWFGRCNTASAAARLVWLSSAGESFVTISDLRPDDTWLQAKKSF